MVTEGLPIPCSTCFDPDDNPPLFADDRARSSSKDPATSPSPSINAVNDALRKLNLVASRSSSAPAMDQELRSSRASFLRSTAGAATPPLASGSAIETPPDSPKRLSEEQPRRSAPSRRDSSFRKTYDEYVTKRANPCENCAMTLPKLQDGSSSERSESRGPTLRTKAPYAKVYGLGDPASAPISSRASPSNSDNEGDIPTPNNGRPHITRRPDPASSPSTSSISSSASRPDTHLHFMEYISTKEPLIPSSFSIVRSSCLRSLSFETLPRPATTGMATPNASPQPSSTPAFVTTHSAGSAASGGPIFFGDPLTGYTTAYIFRIPDVHARGHKRVYALLALSTHRERLAMKTFAFIAAAFRDLALWIQQLAEAEAEKTAEAASPIVGGLGAMYNTGGSGSSSAVGSAHVSPNHNAGAFDRGVSSFLLAGSSFARGGGGPGGGLNLKSRGLPELVGLPDFFIELHTHFVRLLLELGVQLSS